ncbi:MAG: hypothetical protein ACE37B_00805 [Ilumatobacter sp.]|uniref:hypothetical protein n=1 Tax=Ilumatobacter sp. TaxID=1967498 RepID=UPI00391A8188
MSSASIAAWWSPDTDAGVAVQALVTLAVALVGAWFVRREPSLLLLVIGVTMVVMGWYGIRGLH